MPTCEGQVGSQISNCWRPWPITAAPYHIPMKPVCINSASNAHQTHATALTQPCTNCPATVRPHFCYYYFRCSNITPPPPLTTSQVEVTQSAAKHALCDDTNNCKQQHQPLSSLCSSYVKKSNISGLPVTHFMPFPSSVRPAMKRSQHNCIHLQTTL